jgi:hypothetical protein
MNQFLHQAIAVEIKHFTGWYHLLYNNFRESNIRTLTVACKLRERNLFQLVPLVKDLTLDLEDIKILISRTTLEQVKEALEEYNIRRSHIRRKIESFI